jgi:hypothetical protein
MAFKPQTSMRVRLVLLAALLVVCAAGHAQNSAGAAKLAISVADENGAALSGAKAEVRGASSLPSAWCITDYAGHCQISGLVPGKYSLRVEKVGFYQSSLPDVEVGRTSTLEVVLIQQREVREVVNVVESPPTIDPAQTSSQEQITGVQVIDIPYPNTRDYRNVINFIPGVINDINGQPHVAGAETYQTVTILDGFNVTQPANGELAIRVSTDAFRSISVSDSRYGAEFGKGSGGILDLATGIGDDHLRFAATDFIPSLQDKRGLALDKLTPRFTLSGPIRKGKVWFFDAADGEYDNIIYTELPPGSDDDVYWRVGNLAKIQANISSSNILTTAFNYNLSHDQHFGLSPINPQSATSRLDQPVYQGSAKDQFYFAGGELLETGFGFNRYEVDQSPFGKQPYFVTPESAGGNYYFDGHTQADRWQGLANLYLRPRQWHGRHDFKVGLDVDRLAYRARYIRQPVSYLREGESLASPSDCLALTPSPCSRYSTFPGTPSLNRYNAEVSGYAMDRWSATNRLLIEAGIRYDWDQVVRDALISPRLAATYVLDNSGNTKLSAGVGLFYDATPLFLIARPYAGERVDYFFDRSGNPVSGPTITTFAVNPNALDAPRFLNWSLGLEHKLPAQIYLKAGYVRKRGVNGFAYNLTSGSASSSANSFFLQNTREDHYDAFQVSVRRPFSKGYIIMAAYTRSRSRSNEVLDFNVDNPIFSAQAAGPYPWDAPNRFLSWGYVPFFTVPIIGKLDLAWSSELRSGFPFNVVNDQQQLVEPPGSRRFPTYFTLNLHLEKRFDFAGYHWAIRGGFDNIADRRNWLFVSNDIDSPQFLTFSGWQGRAFTARIRFLGRK